MMVCNMFSFEYFVTAIYLSTLLLTPKEPVAGRSVPKRDGQVSFASKSELLLNEKQSRT